MTGIGSSFLARHLDGKPLTLGQAVKAKCADCMGNYADGRVSCENPTCPLFAFMAYNPHKTKRSKRGRVKVRPDNDMSDLGPKQAVPEIGGHSESDA